jgi:choline dehydrogenase-like flavoprotein
VSGGFRSTEHYDVVIIGSGAGGGTLAHALAESGKRILLLERGDFLPREMDNWDPDPVFIQGKYISKDTWYDADGKPFQPQVHYNVGGATKLYGAALYRLRPQDFGALRHVDGVSPAWPLGYDDFEPWYTKAEWLYHVHGNADEDPTEGHHSKPYPWPAVSHEPRIQELSDQLEKGGYHPFHAPCGILLDEADRSRSTCIRCTWCDATPASCTPRPTPRRSPCGPRSTGPT